MRMIREKFKNYTFKDVAVIFGLTWLIAVIVLAGWRMVIWAGLQYDTVADFLAFYAASKMTQTGIPDIAYDVYAITTAAREIFPKFPGVYGWFYPPPMFFLVYPFAWLPVEVSYIIVSLASVILLIFSTMYACGPDRKLLPYIAASSSWAAPWSTYCAKRLSQSCCAASDRSAPRSGSMVPQAASWLTRWRPCRRSHRWHRESGVTSDLWCYGGVCTPQHSGWCIPANYR